MDSFEQAVHSVQFLGVDAIERANSGHPGAVMGLAGIGVDIFTRYLRYCPEDPSWANRDRFVLSCGHASMLLYGLLHMAGYGLSLDDLKSFRQGGSRTPGHPERGVTPGVETTTGPLGQGFATAVGMALAGKLAAARVNEPGSALLDYRVFVLASDGDLMEGISAEAASLAGLWKLNNLIVVYDDNKITIDGSTDLSFRENIAQRFEAVGWRTTTIDGHNPAEFRAAMDAAVAGVGVPTLIIARTTIARGSPGKAGKPSAHGSPLGAAEVSATKQACGWPEEPKFHVPEEARALFRARVEQNRKTYQEWQKQLALVSGERKERWLDLATQRLPEDLFEYLIGTAESKADATRILTHKALQRVAARVPCLLGGSADLFASNKTKIESGGAVSAGDFGGRNVYFGIREHAMAAICNGLALSGFFIPFGSTFLIFSDYLRPSLRLAALMGLRVLHVLSHDSVFVGEDGPTHQPLEQTSSLRMIPNLDVLRPADSLEVAAAWTAALERKDGPSVLLTSRQTIPTFDRPAGFSPRDMLRGAYVVRDAKKLDLVILASGSEVPVAIEAAAIIASKKGIGIRVVSVPCWERFEREPAEYREAVLPRGVRRASVEAGTTLFWRGIVGLDGVAIGIDDYAHSAPAELLVEELGLTGPKVAERLLRELAL